MQHYHQSPISDDDKIEISNNRPSRAISPYQIEYAFVPIKGEPNLYHKEYYVKKPKPFELPDYGPPYRDDIVIRNQIHGKFRIQIHGKFKAHTAERFTIYFQQGIPNKQLSKNSHENMVATK